MKLTTIQLELIAEAPAQPQPKGTRQAFEAWYSRRYGYDFSQATQDTWKHAAMCDAWEVWQAAAPSPAPVDDDLATVIEQYGPTVIQTMIDTTEEIAIGVLKPSKGPEEVASADDWVREIAPLMQADFKDWWQNSPREWPRLTAEVIKGLRKSEAFWIEQATRVRPNGTEPVARVVRNQAGQISMQAPDGSPFDMSKHVGAQLYAQRPIPSQDTEQ